MPNQGAKIKSGHNEGMVYSKFRYFPIRLRTFICWDAFFSPADIQLDPEMRFKLFFLADSCCLDVTLKESD